MGKTNKGQTEAERKLIAHRKSGYTGPIDRNGDKATSGRAVEILDAVRAADEAR